MKKTFFRAVILLASLFAFSDNIQAQMTAKQFNEHIALITDSLYVRGTAWGTAFNEAYTSKDFASLTPMRIQLEKYIDIRILELRNMPDVNDSKDFREAMIDFLVFEKGMITSGFIPIEKLSKDATAEEIKLKLDKLTLFSEQEQEALKKVGIVQEAYAKANGFRIETEEEKKQKMNKD